MSNVDNKNIFGIMLVGIAGIILFLAPKINLNTKSDEKPFVVGSSSKELDSVTKVFSEIDSVDDKRLIHTMFAGAAEYLKNSKKLQSTNQFDPILGRVQSSYSWDREKYPKFTDAVSDYLVSVGYDEPKELKSSSDRDSFSKIFSELAEATKYER